MRTHEEKMASQRKP